MKIMNKKTKVSVIIRKQYKSIYDENEIDGDDDDDDEEINDDDDDERNEKEEEDESVCIQKFGFYSISTNHCRLFNAKSSFHIYIKCI